MAHLQGEDDLSALGRRPSQVLGSMWPERGKTAEDSKLTKADQRRLARKQREAEWQAFNETRPDDKWVWLWECVHLCGAE